MMMPIENVHVVMKLVQPVSALSLSIIALLVLLLLEIISIWTEFLSLAHKPVLKDFGQTLILLFVFLVLEDAKHVGNYKINVLLVTLEAICLISSVFLLVQLTDTLTIQLILVEHVLALVFYVLDQLNFNVRNASQTFIII
jgi:hypothetical protein